MHKIKLDENGLTIDGFSLKFVKDYQITGSAEEPTELKITLLVDDSDSFKGLEYKFKP